MAVKSAMGQDYDNLEIIVSDDSTDDETFNLLKEMASDRRVFYYKNPENIGRVANYRKCLYELAKGDWVVMLDGDDYYIDRSYISKAINVIQGNPSIVLVGAGIRVLNEASHKFSDRPLVSRDIIYSGGEIFKEKIQLPNHQTDIYLRRLACDLDFYRDPSMGSDSESLFRLCLHGNVAYLSEIAAVWRIHDSNTTFNRDISKQITEIKFIDSVYKYSLGYVSKVTAKQWRKYMYRGMTFHLLHVASLSGRKFYTLKIILLFGKYLGPRAVIHQLIALFRRRNSNN
jgi:glycosyltransferase involved in cell wall biosynthesis